MALGLILVAAGVSSVSGQQPQQPRFVSSANLRTVDFHVLGQDGLPLTDLKAEEVSVKLDGKTRKVTNLTLVAVADATAPGVKAPTPLPAPFASNSRSDSGRVVVIAIEDESFRVGRERAMKEALLHFLDQLSPRDQVGVVTMPHGGWKAHPTTDRARVKDALSNVIGHAGQSESADDAACRTRTTLESLATMLHQMGSAGVPPTVLFFSSKMSGPTGIRTPRSATGASGIAGQVDSLGACELIPLTFNRVGIAAGTARAHFYVIQPDDEPLATQSLEGLENLAGVTGATRLAIAANGATTLDRVLRETTAFYLAGFEPEDSDNNGMSHAVEIRVSRPGAKVRSRPEVMLEKVGFGATIATTTPREMLREGRVYRDLPIRALGYVSRNSDKDVKVLVAAEPEDPSRKFAQFEAALFDGQGKMIAGYVGDAVTVAKTPVIGAFIVPPGNYRLRVAATDASNQGGTTDQEIDASITAAGPLKMSSLVLGLSRGGDFLPKLQFSTEPVAVTFLEIYGGQKGQRVGAWLELSQTADGAPFLMVPLVVEGTTEEDKFKAMGAVPIGSLPPGDYVVRAVVQLEGSPAGHVTRTIRKVQ
jgi:hypothetical protein